MGKVIDMGIERRAFLVLITCIDCIHREYAALPEVFDVGNVKCERCGFTNTVVTFLPDEYVLKNFETE